MAKSDVYNTKNRSTWNPRPPTDNFQPKGKPVGNTRGLNKTPVIKSTTRIGTTYNFPATGRSIGMQSNKVGGAIGRPLYSTAVNMKIHQQFRP